MAEIYDETVLDALMKEQHIIISDLLQPPPFIHFSGRWGTTLDIVFILLKKNVIIHSYKEGSGRFGEAIVMVFPCDVSCLGFIS